MGFNKGFIRKIAYRLFENFITEGKGQGALELLVLVGSAIMIVVVVFSLYGSMSKVTALRLNESVGEVTSAIDSASQDSVTLCHIPPGNPNAARTMTVKEDEVPVHLAHGDHIGPCV